MKQILFIISTILLFGCNSKQNNTSTAIIEKNYESVKIDTISYKVNANDSDKCGYYILEFVYPNITGLKNTKFQKELNDKLIENVKPYIESVKSNIKTYNLIHSNYKPLEGGIENYEEDIPGELYISFDVLSSDSIISIIQYFTMTVGNGGNGSLQSFSVTNCNTVKGVFLNTSDFNTESNNIAFINDRIKVYFDQSFLEEKEINEINYPYIMSNSELKNLNYGIRNDSIMLIIEATPSANYSYGTYIIPVDKKRK